MKSLKALIVSLVLLALPFSASAAFTVPQGGTGYDAIKSGSIIFGDAALRIGTSTSLQWDKNTNKLTIANLDTTTNITFGGVTGNSWDDFCVAITGTSTLCDGIDGGIASTSPFSNGGVLYAANNAAAATVATGTVSGSSQVSVTSSRSVLGGALAIDIVGDSIGDTQLAFNTGQNLTTASTPTFAGVLAGTSTVQALNTGTTTATSTLRGPSNADPQVVAGSIAHDTTEDQWILGTSTGAGYVRPDANYMVLGYASSTFTGTSTQLIGGGALLPDLTAHSLSCYTNTGTANVSMTDGTNITNTIAVTTSTSTPALSTNNVFLRGEKIQINYGTPASNVQRIGCTLEFSFNRR